MISVTTGGVKGGRSPTTLKKEKKKPKPCESALLGVLPAEGMQSSAVCRLLPHSVHVVPAPPCWPRAPQTSATVTETGLFVFM